MKKEDLIKLGLSDEDAKGVIDSLSDEFKNYIPKVRFDEVNTTKKQLENDLKERDRQLEELKNSNDNVEDLKNKIIELQNENKTSKEKFETEMKELKITNAVEKSLNLAKAKNIKAVKALLELESTELLEDGSIKGLDKQIKDLKSANETSFLFDSNEKQTIIKGVRPSEGSSNTKVKRPNEMNYSELCEYMKTNI